MPNINLLPWREAQRIKKNRLFYGIYGGTLMVALAILFVVYGVFDEMVESQQKENQYLESAIQRLMFQIKRVDKLDKEKESLLKKNLDLNRLKTERTSLVFLFNSVAESTPEGIYLTSLEREGKKVILVGEAQKNNMISVFMNNLERFSWFSNPVLSELQSEELAATADFRPQLIQFSLEVQFEII